jgi:hypothetical protein
MADASREKALAGRIRESGSDTYDLAGYSPAAAADLVVSAFGAPIETAEMMKVTLVVGGGKKVRTAYGGTEGLVRDVCAALEKLGFKDDRGASCALECAGSFKYQHDTDKVCRPARPRRRGCRCAPARWQRAAESLSGVCRLRSRAAAAAAVSGRATRLRERRGRHAPNAAPRACRSRSRLALLSQSGSRVSRRVRLRLF